MTDGDENMHGETHGSRDCPGGLALMRLHTDDLPSTEREVVALHVRGCDRCAAVVREMDGAREQALELDPFEQAYPRWLQRAGDLPQRDPVAAPLDPLGAWWRHQWLGLRRLTSSPRTWAAAAMVVAAVALVVALRPTPPAPTPDRSGPLDPVSLNRLKGVVSLEMYALRDGAVVEVAAGEALRPGDRIQFAYTSGPLNNLVLVGVDGRGVISRYYPDEGGLSLEVVPGSEVVLEDSLVLDDAPGPEVFVAVFSDRSLDVLAVERAAHDALVRGGDDPRAVLGLDLPAHVPGVVATTWIDKDLEGE